VKESAVKARIKQILKEHKVWYYMPIPHGLRAVADFQCCVDGRFLMIEAKASRGRQSPQQKLVERKVREHGGWYWLIGPDELESLGRRLEELRYGKTTH